MVAQRTREEIYEDAELEAELEEFLAEEEKELAAITRGAESSRLIEENHDPTRLVWVYVNSTGEPRHVPVWTLQGKNSILRRRTHDGTREFVTRPPAGKEWKQGNVKCLLHPDHPRRKEFDELGLMGKTCGALTGKHAGSLASEFALEIHMQHRHRQEWATIQAYESRKRDEEYREFQRLQTQAARIAVEAAAKRATRKAAE